MTSAGVDSFFNEPEGEVFRDQGRPVLVPRSVSPSAGIKVVYTRASSMAEYVSDSQHFHKWEMRGLARGLGIREDLAALAASETYCSGLTNVPERGEKARSGRRLDAIIERAHDAVRWHEKADYGTAFHAHTE